LRYNQVMTIIISMGAKSFSDQIRDSVNASGMSRYDLCNRIGLNQSTMSRFMSGKGACHWPYWTSWPRFSAWTW
jgi:hypothetical protein